MPWREIPALYETGQVARVVRLAKAALREDPTRDPVRFYLARALQDLARYSEANDLLESLIAGAEPESVAPYESQLGILHEQWCRPEVAEEWHRRAVATDPSDASRLILLGAFLAKQGRVEEAEAVHRTATRCEEGPLDEAWHNLGLVLRSLDRYDEAAFCFRQALRIDPAYGEAQSALEDVHGAGGMSTS